LAEKLGGNGIAVSMRKSMCYVRSCVYWWVGILRIGIILTFEGLGVLIRYFVWSVWGKSFIIDLILVRKRLGESIWGGGMSRESLK